MTDDPTIETFQEELDLVIARHADLFNQMPAYMVAMLIHEADYRPVQHNVDLDVREAADGIWMLDMGDSGAVIGESSKDPSRLAEVDEEFVSVGPRGLMDP